VTRRWGAAGGLLLLAAVAAFPNAPRAVAAAPGDTTTSAPLATGVGPNPSGATLRLVSQTAWVEPGMPFDLDVQIHVAQPLDQVLVDVAVYGVLGSRSGYEQSLTTGWSGYVVSHPLRDVPLTSLSPDKSGTIHLSIPTGSLAPQLHLNGPGVYPVIVAIRSRGIGAPLAQFTTDLIATPATVTRKLAVAWVVPVHAAPANPAVPNAPLPADEGFRRRGRSESARPRRAGRGPRRTRTGTRRGARTPPRRSSRRGRRVRSGVLRAFGARRGVPTMNLSKCLDNVVSANRGFSVGFRSGVR